MKKLELSNIYLHLERELNHLSLSTSIFYRNVLKDDVQEVISSHKDEIDSWISQLSERYISCYDLENLLESKREDIQLPGLTNLGMSSHDVDQLKGDILSLIAKSIMNSYLDSLFKKPATSRNIEFKKGNWF